jgi:hypothetical protein
MIHTYLVCKYVQICVNPCKFYLKKEKKILSRFRIANWPLLSWIKMHKFEKEKSLNLIEVTFP